MVQNRYVKLGLTLFCVVGAVTLFYNAPLYGRFLTALRPVLYGALMAYLLAPMVNWFEGGLRTLRRKDPPRRGAALRAVSILLAWAVIGLLFYLLASVLMPELYKSVQQLISNAETYYRTISGWVEDLLESNSTLEQWVAEQMDDIYKELSNWVTRDMLPQAQQLMVAVSGGLVTMVSFLGDLLVGVIVSVYLLATKERCAAYARKMVYGLVPWENVSWVLRGAAKADAIFSGFVRGKLLDSLIIGILCFIGCSILNFPYTPLVSVIVGVTNVIPFFGPFLGAIPSTFLILLVSPLKALYFVIFVLALQQLDGNVIGPKILGDKTGLSSLWVIIAILVGGSFFGIPGMFFGVPVCACFHSAVNFLVESRLRRKGLPLDSAAYEHPDHLPRSGEEP